MKILPKPFVAIQVYDKISARSEFYKQLMINKNGLRQFEEKIDNEIIALEAGAPKRYSCARIPKHYLIVRAEYDQKAISSSRYAPYVHKLILLGKVDLAQVKPDTIEIEFNGLYGVDIEAFPVIYLNGWKKII